MSFFGTRIAYSDSVMRTARMIKSHWKKILLSVYVLIVLIISATVKAEAHLDEDLKKEIRAISQQISFLQDRGLLNESGLEADSALSSQALPQHLTGQFQVSEDFLGNLKIYFIALPSKVHFDVDQSSVKNFKPIDLKGTYTVDGFVVKQSLSQPQHMPHLIVTSLKLQR